MKISITVPAGERGAFTIGSREHEATLADLPAGAQSLLNMPITATLACLNATGTIHQSPVWVDIDADHILLNTVRGRAKDRNLRARPNLSLMFTDPDDSYRWMSIQGRVAGVIDEAGGATKQVEELRNAFERDHVDAVLGYVGSGDCLAVSPAAEELKQLLVLFDCGTPRIFEEAKYKYVFRTAAHGAMDNVAMARYLVKRGAVASGKRVHLRQGVEMGRPSELYLSAQTRLTTVSDVRVGGSTVLVAKGRLFLP